MSGPMKIRGNKELGFPLGDVLIVRDGIKQKKATAGALTEPWQRAWI